MQATPKTGVVPALVGGLCLILTGTGPETLRADVVHLTNGRSMEGVILEETTEQILLKVPFGEIGLPSASVQRIERGRSALEDYLESRAALELRQGTALQWLDLALWAQQEGLDHSAREATLVAARLDPGLPGLVPQMTALGYAYDENLAIWLPHDEFMRRRGYVLSNGRWLSPDQALAFKRAQQAAVVSELERQRQDRLARAVEMMVLAQVVQAEETRRLREEESVPRYGLPLWGGYPVVVAPGYWPRPPHRPEHYGHGEGGRPRRAEIASRRSHRDAIVSRSPGSLIPVTPARSHRGSMQPPPNPR